ncbi:formimidoylglutamate deiminase [Azospirillum sp. sgz302134]
MTTLHFASALLGNDWHDDVRLHVEGGRIARLETGVPAASEDERHAVALPGVASLHSHAFQRGMAGLAELRGATDDNFWSWREIMYRFLRAMTPEDVEAVAAFLYVELLEAGFTRIGEFHYLHHDADGRPYADPAETAARIGAAAAETGIGLTLLPVFYAHSTFGGAPPNAGQRRFISDLDLFARILERCRDIAAALPGANVGVAPHSLRAVTPEELSAVVAMAEGAPIHVHAAEQVREVEDCLAWSGARPVEWLLANQPVDSGWCLIHATHMTPEEIAGVAARGAVAGLCPITEGNLGDGILDTVSFAAAGGRFGIGTDSNVQIGLAEELRMLEYAQRLVRRARNVLAAPMQSSGNRLLMAALEGGTQALGQGGATGLAVGAPADIVSLDVAQPSFVGRRHDQILDTWIFSAGSRAVDCVWVRGTKLVEGGVHRARAAVGERYATVMRRLMA